MPAQCGCYLDTTALIFAYFLYSPTAAKRLVFTRVFLGCLPRISQYEERKTALGVVFFRETRHVDSRRLCQMCCISDLSFTKKCEFSPRVKYKSSLKRKDTPILRIGSAIKLNTTVR